MFANYMINKKIKRKKWDYKKCFFLVLSTSWITGLTFFILSEFFIINGEFGAESHPWQFPILKIHGASSFFIMVIFGYFLSAHVKKNWHSKNKKPLLGIVLLLMPILSMITAYTLYYISSDSFRNIVGYIHLFIGFLLPFILIAHIFQMKSISKNKRNEGIEIT
ncbi:MAG: hypothetical protein ACI9IL_000547 [Rickettsiales bacterium]|jgi:hypothetical protein